MKLFDLQIQHVQTWGVVAGAPKLHLFWSASQAERDLDKSGEQKAPIYARFRWWARQAENTTWANYPIFFCGVGGWCVSLRGRLINFSSSARIQIFRCCFVCFRCWSWNAADWNTQSGLFRMCSLQTSFTILRGFCFFYATSQSPSNFGAQGTSCDFWEVHRRDTSERGAGWIL